jgi:hypothetical protein
VVTIARAAGHECRPRSLRCPRGDQGHPRLRHAGSQGGETEHADADHERQPSPEDIGETTSQKQQATEAQRVRSHHPGQRHAVETKVGADGRQRDVDHRYVDDDHQLC